jgi:hypothetical protein
MEMARVPLTFLLPSQTRLKSTGLIPVALSSLAFVLVCHHLQAAGVTLAWDANPELDVAGYRLQYGTPPGNYSVIRDVGKVTSYQVPSLLAGQTYRFRVTCYNTSGLESDPSNSVDYSVPATSNRPPIANNPSVSTAEDHAIAVTLSASDPDGAALTYSLVGQPERGSVSGTPPAVTYRPLTNYFGSDSFRFRASDGSLSSTGTVSVTVTAVNDAPTAVSRTYNLTPGQRLYFTLRGTDPDSNSLTHTIVSRPSNGRLRGTPPKLNYRPNSRFRGNDRMTFRVSDGSLSSSVGTITFRVQASTTQNLTLASTDGSDADLESIDGLTISFVPGDPEGHPMLRLQAPPRPVERILLQTSPDLQHWETVSDEEPGEGLDTLTEADSMPVQYFRVIREPSER